MRKLKLGVLGVGPRGEYLTCLYAKFPYVEITAICDRADGAAERVAKKYCEESGNQNVKVYTDYNKMMRERNFEALFITVDPDKQVDFACDAMERGVHVMTEVPCCTTIDQCWKLVKTVEKTGAKYQLAEQTRYWYFISQWRKMAQNGDLGKILMVEGQYLHYEPKWDFFVNKKTGEHIQTNSNELDNNPDFERSWRYNVFQNPIYYLPHTLSPLLSITGGRIEKVSCMGTKLGSYCMDGVDVCDIQSALMHSSNDVIFNVRAGFTSPHSRQSETGAHWYNVKGTKGSVEWCRGETDKPKMWTLENGWSEHPEWTCSDESADDEMKNSAHGGADGYPIKYFADAIFNDTTPLMDVYKAVESAAPAILAAESAKLGGALLEVPDFRPKK